MLVSILNRGILLDGILKFKHHQRQTISEYNTVRNAMMFSFNDKLIDELEGVIPNLCIINRTHIQVWQFWIGTFQRKALLQKSQSFYIFSIYASTFRSLQLSDSPIDFIFGYSFCLISFLQEMAQIIVENNISCVTSDILSMYIVITLIFKEFYKRLF